MPTPKGPRKCSNWLKTLAEYVENNESPRHFWMWAGISTIAGALQRKVWLPFGLKSDTIYPCLYIMIVAPPGETRKAAPVTFSKEILQKIKVGVFVDSPTKRALTKYMAELAKTQFFYWVNEDGVRLPQVHCSVSLISKELSSFMAVDAKSMVEVLTDIYDPHDLWEYKTSGEGFDSIKGVCVNCLFATTPSWIANNLPEGSIGGGFTSRFVIVSGREKYKWCSRPPAPDEKLFNALTTDLVRIQTLKGAFQWSEEAEQVYDQWYLGTEKLLKENRDRKVRPFISRMPTIAIKVAMCLHVAYSDDLILESSDMEQAIALVMDILRTASEALGGQGGAQDSAVKDRIMRQVQMLSRDGYVSFTELLRLNFSDLKKRELEEIMETIQAMEVVDVKYDANSKPTYKWKGITNGQGSGGKRHKSRGKHEAKE